MIMIVGKPLHQWEQGRQVKYTGDKITQLHFAHKGDVEAKVMEVTQEDGVYVAEIPNVLLQQDKQILVYAVAIDGGNRQTLESKALPVYQQEKPADYVYTQTRVKSVERAVQEALEELKATGQLPKGDKGDKGDDGYSPIRGLDYWTEEDKAEIISETKTGAIGDIETALDNIIAIQEELMGGDGV